jgi:predicted ATPase
VLKTLAVANYRSIRDMVVPLAPLTVITGPNGSGKSNLYRALRLLSETVRGGIVATLAREGGLDSTLWAGPESLSRRMKLGEAPVQGTSRNGPVSLRLGFADEALAYSIDVGIPAPSSSVFARDPIIKRECIFASPVYRPSALMVDRRNALVRLRDDHGKWEILTDSLRTFDTMLSELNDPERAPEILRVRDMVRGWRFYDYFRTDAESPARQPCVATRTPVLAPDGRHLAAALETIREIGDGPALDAAVADAFPGARVGSTLIDGRLKVEFAQPGILRPLDAAELSDGTLRYLLWVAALLTPRPPSLMVLNEPETSLHPDLLPAAARLIARAAERTQVWVVTHARQIVSTMEEDTLCNAIQLGRPFGQTEITSRESLDEPAWHWPER